MNASEIMQKDFVSAETDEKISSLVGKFKKKKVTDAVVLRNRVFEGMIRKRGLLRLKQNINEMPVKDITIKVPELKASTPVEDIPALMASADTSILPVVEKGSVMGVVTVQSLLNALRKTFKGIKAFELLNEPVVLEESGPVSKAINFFKQKKIDHLPIINAKGKLTGVVSVGDLIMKYFLFPPKREQRYGKRLPLSHTYQEENLSHLPVGNEMRPIVYTANRDSPAAELIDIFKEQKISSIIITEDNIPAGIVTTRDFLRLYSEITSA